MNAVHRVCAIAVELALVFVFVLLILAPFHGASTRHLTVTQTIDATRAEISGDVAGLTAGDTVSLYRFNHSWKAPIGKARIEEVSQTSAKIRIDPRDFVWPIGAHGTVTRDANGTYSVSLGEAHGFADGDSIHLFRDRVNIGQVQIVHVGESQSEILIPLGMDTDSAPLTASEFTYATQVSVFQDRLLTAIEIGVLVSVLVAYVLIRVRTQRSPLIVLGALLRRIRIPRRLSFWGVNILAGVPFVWFMSNMPLYLGAYLATYTASQLFSQQLNLYPAIGVLVPYAYALLAILYYGFLGISRTSPILAFWKRISYKGRSSVKSVSFTRGLVLWALHLIIVYAFAWTLLGFLRGDVQAALAIGFPAPTMEAAFEQAKFLIWALTIVGVLIGYGYSVLSILWGQYIRNLDFTVTGWLTNGFCYPFLGIIIWQITPAFTGIDPIITGGPLLYLMLILGLVLNILYMLSIFNLGILFDLMTDKGVRTSGFYSVIRHPNYTLEASMFVVTELVGLTMGVHWLGISMFVFLYWLRSEREDNFMEWSNPDYSTYQKATPWKFIPGIY